MTHDPQPPQPAYPQPPTGGHPTTPSPAPKPRPSAWWWTGPAVLVLASIVSVALGVALFAQSISVPRTNVIADGRPHSVQVVDAHTYLIWVDDSRPTDCSVWDASGSELPLRSPQATWEVNEWDSAFTFTARGDRVEISCTSNGRVGAPHVLVGELPEIRGFAGGIVLGVLVPIALGGFAFVWAIILLVVTLTRPSRRAVSAGSPTL